MKKLTCIILMMFLLGCSNNEMKQYENEHFNKEIGTIGNNASDPEFRGKFYEAYIKYLKNRCYEKEWLDELGLTVGDFQRYVNGAKKCKEDKFKNPKPNTPPANIPVFPLPNLPSVPKESDNNRTFPRFDDGNRW